MTGIFKASDAADRAVPKADCACTTASDYRVVRELRRSGECKCSNEFPDDAVLHAQSVNPKLQR